MVHLLANNVWLASIEADHRSSITMGKFDVFIIIHVYGTQQYSYMTEKHPIALLSLVHTLWHLR